MPLKLSCNSSCIARRFLNLLFNFPDYFPAFIYKCMFPICRLLRKASWQTWKPRLITEKPIKRNIIWMEYFYKVCSEVAFSITIWRDIKAGNYYLLILQCVPALFLKLAKQNQKNKLARIISSMLRIYMKMLIWIIQ